ncbi:MAG: 3-phosphoshikimate 1-carboxyvinyltransferase [Salinirussus sp.]
MHVTVSPSDVAGRTRAPPSKSYTHRAILAAGFDADGTTRIRDPLVSADTRATMRAVEAFGGSTDRRNCFRSDRENGAGSGDDGAVPTLTVEGFGSRPDVPADVIDCANSGTTMRLVTAAAALVDGTTVLTGDESLRSRPQGPLLNAIDQLGGRARSTRSNGRAPLVVGGPIVGGPVAIPGDVSSQFVTALLLTGALTDAGITISLESPLKSAPYVDITREVMDAFGVRARQTDDGFSVQGRQRYDADEYRVPGDFSSISYLLAAGAVAGTDGGVTVTGARPSAQGDQAIVDIVDRMGGEVDWDRETGTLTVHGSSLTGVEVSVADTPDLLPTVAALGAAAAGTTVVTDAEHVRYKETDRVSAIADALSAMGADVEENEATLVVHGGASDLRGTTLDGRGDHRIVMALAVAALAASGPTTIEGAEHVDVSFPGFFDALAGLGADLDRSRG